MLSDKLKREMFYDKYTGEIREHVVNCGIPIVEVWAKVWLSGEDLSEASAVKAGRVVEAAGKKNTPLAEAVRRAKNLAVAGAAVGEIEQERNDRRGKQ